MAPAASRSTAAGDVRPSRCVTAFGLLPRSRGVAVADGGDATRARPRGAAGVAAAAVSARPTSASPRCSRPCARSRSAPPATPCSPAPTRRRCARPATPASTTAPRARCAAALELAPRNAAALTERGALELSRHDFRGGLRDAPAARRLAPDGRKPFGVLVDALVELGRYGQAERALQEMVDRKPDLAAYARVSYFRELHGDLDGARDALRAAVTRRRRGGGERRLRPDAARPPRPARGRLAAPRATREALVRFPATRRRARRSRACEVARGDLRGAIRRTARASSRGCRCPST